MDPPDAHGPRPHSAAPGQFSWRMAFSLPDRHLPCRVPALGDDDDARRIVFVLHATVLRALGRGGGTWVAGLQFIVDGPGFDRRPPRAGYVVVIPALRLGPRNGRPASCCGRRRGLGPEPEKGVSGVLAWRWPGAGTLRPPLAQWAPDPGRLKRPPRGGAEARASGVTNLNWTGRGLMCTAIVRAEKNEETNECRSKCNPPTLYP